MNRRSKCVRRKFAATVMTGGMLFQFGGCDFGSVTTSVTLSGEELIISLVRAAILDPIDQFVTDQVNAAFGNDE